MCGPNDLKGDKMKYELSNNYVWEIRKDNAKVAAFVDCLTGRVLYPDRKDEEDPEVAEAVAEALAAVQENPVHVKLPNRNGIVTLQMRTERGLFEASAEPKDLFDGKKDAMYISFQPSANPYVYADLLAAKTDGKDVEFYIWSDITDEDYQGDPIVISGREIDDVIDSCREQTA